MNIKFFFIDVLENIIGKCFKLMKERDQKRKRKKKLEK